MLLTQLGSNKVKSALIALFFLPIITFPLGLLDSGALLCANMSNFKTKLSKTPDHPNSAPRNQFDARILIWRQNCRQTKSARNISSPPLLFCWWKIFTKN